MKNKNLEMASAPINILIAILRLGGTTTMDTGIVFVRLRITLYIRLFLSEAKQEDKK